MAQQKVNLGTQGNDGSGDAIRVAFSKVNDNFAELYGTSPEANDLVEDTSPQLGGSLEVNGNSIVKGSGTAVVIEDLKLVTATLTPNTTNTTLTLAGSGTGKISLSGIYWPTVDGAPTQVLQTDGSGTLSWVNNAGGGGGDTGDLSFVGSTIHSPSNADITLDPSGTGGVTISSALGTTGQITTGAITLPNTDGTVNQVLKTDGAGTVGWTSVSISGTTFVGDDSTGTLVSPGETFQFAGATGITTAVSGDTLTITGPTLTSFITASSSDTLTNKGGNISQWTNNSNYISDANLTVVGDDSTGVTFSAKDGDNIKIAGGSGITTAVTGDTVTITASGGAGTQNLFETVTGDSGTTSANTTTDTLTITGGTGIATAVSGDTLTITASGGAGTQNLFETVTGDSGTTSANTTTDTLTIAGGTGIATAVSGDTLTITASGGAGTQNLFQSIAVSGQSNVVADSTTDTLTLVAGTGVTLTTNAGADSVTINSTGATTPGGATTQVQFNNAGAFGGDADFVYDSSANKLTVKNIETESISPPSNLVGTYTISSPTTITLDPVDEIINDAPMKLVNKTVAQLNAITSSVGSVAYCTNQSTGAEPCYFDGSDWRTFSGKIVITA